MILEEENKPTSFPRCISKALTSGGLSSLLPRPGAAAVPGWGRSREAVPGAAQTLVKKGGIKKQNEEKAEKVGALKGYGPSLVSQRASPLLLGPDFSTCASIPARSTALVKVGKGEKE